MLTMLHCFCHRDRRLLQCSSCSNFTGSQKVNTKSCFRVSTGQGKLEKVRDFVWSGKVRERSGKYYF